VNKKYRKKIVILTINFLVLIGLVSSFTFTTYAWFVTKKQATIKAEMVQVAAPGFEIHDYQVYPVTEIVNGATSNTYTFENSQAIRMPRFDPQNIEYSQYRRALVVHITFTYRDMSNVTFYAKTLNSAFHTGTLTSEFYDENITSNVFQLTYSSGTTLTSGWTTATLTYNKSDTSSFVNATVTPPTKVSAIPIRTITNADTELWFVIEYNQVTMEYINTIRANEVKEVWYNDDITYHVGAL